MVGKKAERLLCIDVGNTSVSCGLFYGRRLKRLWHWLTNNIPKIASDIRNIDSNIPIDYALISSVVPKITLKLGKIIRSKFWVVGGNLGVRIKHNYKPLKKLGADRLVTAYGGMKLYGRPLLILDFGTALTCDYISRQGVFEGGLIIPGPEIAWEALAVRTALLPKISFPKGKSRLPVLGRDTRTGMEAGILQGYGALADGLVERFQRRFGRGFRVVATGGLASTIYPYTRRIDVVDPLLTLKSLVEAFQDRKKFPS